MTEIDIMLNKYYDWDLHGSTSSTEVCLLNVLMHEMGHGAGLDHVEYDPDDPNQGHGNCSEWAHYTMRAGSAENEHDKETLSCEDKWALLYTY